MQVSKWSFVASVGLVLAALAACSDDEGAPSTSATDAGSDGLGETVDASETPPDGGGDAASDADPSGSLGTGPFTLAYAGNTVGIDMRPIESGKATFDGLKLTGYEASPDERPLAGTNTVYDANGDALVALGRWAGGTTGGKFYNSGNGGLFDIPANGGFHYVIGKYTETIPASGSASYSELFKTAATKSDGTKAPGTISGTLAAAFAGQDTKIGFSLTIAVPDESPYTISTTGGAGDVSTTEAKLSPADGKVKGSFFVNALTVTNGSGTCSGDCAAVVRGFIGGPNADRIALVAHVTKGVGGTPTSIAAAIAFGK